MQHYSITFKRKGDDRIVHGGQFASSVSEAKEKAKATWGDIKIISCVKDN